VDDRDAPHEPREIERLLERGVTAPTTTTSWSLKKNPSQVAQVEDAVADEEGLRRQPEHPGGGAGRDDDRLALDAASAVRTTNGRRVKSTSTTSSPSMSVPNRSACLRIVSISSGPSTGRRSPGSSRRAS